MKYWDSSAVVPLLIRDSETERLTELYRSDPVIITWWGTEIECVSALARVEQEAPDQTLVVGQAFERLDALSTRWHEIQSRDTLRELARRLLRVHHLLPIDSLQLAAAIVAAEHHPASLPFVCLDRRLVDAARREGFREVLYWSS